MALDLQKFIARFVGEGRDHLARLADGLGALETRPHDAELVNTLFRAAHTVKGSARMLKLSGISTLAHHLEDLLAALRDGSRQADPALISVLLTGVDAIAAQLDQVAAGTADPPADPALCAALAAALASDPEPAAAVPTPAPAPAPATDPSPTVPAGQASQASETNGISRSPASPPDDGGAVAVTTVVTDTEAGATTATATTASAPRTADAVRVPLTKLDELVALIGEVRSLQQRLHERLRQAQALDRSLRPLAARLGDPALRQTGTTLARFARELRDDVQAQELVTAALGERALVLRMLPLSMVFDPSARMVRELARELGKEVRCEVEGGDIELDRRIIEGLGDALMHVLRNAVDHGIEDPASRRAAGKPAVGQIRISARALGGGVSIEVSDDGRGLSRDAILAKAVRAGLLDAPAAAALTDEEVWELVYAPGLSTSEIITDLSGRGVGMDAIRSTIIDDLHGAIALRSHAGAGSRVSFKLPLSLAVMHLVLFTDGGQTYGLAAQHVVELIRISAAETVQLAGRPAVVLRNEFIPLLPLAELLRTAAPGGGSPPSTLADAAAVRPPRSGSARLAVIINVRQAKLGLLIERLVDARDMVLKPLPEPLRGSGLVTGIVSTGDNTLVSILQAPALMDAARYVRGESTRRAARDDNTDQATTTGRRVLVVDDSLNTREIVKEVLEACGYRVTTAEDGLDGWQKASGGQFDAVLTDVEMPGMDGFSFTARLRTHDRYRSTPIIIITSRESADDKRRGIEVGADAYIVKGDFDQSGLLDTLGNLLGDGV